MNGRRRAALAGVAATLSLGYLVAFRRYGLNVEDEGLLLYTLQRVIRGEIPYLDFASGYTPGFFYTAAAMLHVSGSLPVFRLGLAVVHALTVTGLVLLSLRIARPALAVMVPLLYLAFIPVLPGQFCAFNVPYPAWFASLGFVLTAGAMTTFLVSRRRGWLVAGGLAAAATLAMKPNAGVYAIGGATAVLLALTDPYHPERAEVPERGGRSVPQGGGRTVQGGRVVSALLWALLWIGVVGGAWMTLGPPFDPLDVAVYLGPLTVGMAALVTRARIRRRDLLGDVVALLAPFALVSAAWLGFFFWRLGATRFVREVLLIGSGAAELYYERYPALQPWAAALTVGVFGFAVVGLALQRERVSLRPAIAGLLAAAAALVIAIERMSLMPERLTWSIIWQLESAGFPLVLATHIAGAGWLWRRRHAPGAEPAVAVLLLAFFMQIQLFPRADFMHLAGALPLTAVFAAFLLDRALRWWEAGLAAAGASGLGRVAAPGVAALLVAVIALRLGPSVTAVTEPQYRLPFPNAPVGVETERAADLRALGAASARLAREVRFDGAALGFPAIDAALFLAGARNPTPYAYFYPGRPDHAEEAAVIDTLAAHPPAGLVSLNREWSFFRASPVYYLLLRRFVRARYALLARYGRFDVLGLRAPEYGASEASTPAGEPGVPTTAEETPGELGRRLGAISALAERPLEEAAPQLLEHASGDDATLRRAALEALLDALERTASGGLESTPSAGLERWVAAAGLDRRREVLLLRTLRDDADPRAASYLFAAAQRDDRRIAREALGAMYMTRWALIARRNLWAGQEEPAVWPGRRELLAAVDVTLGDPTAPVEAAALAAELAGALGDRDAIELLRVRMLAGTPPSAGAAAVEHPPVLADAAITASAATSLATLAPRGLACALTPLLARRELDVVALLPSALVALAEGPEPTRREARECLAAALTAPEPIREQAIWAVAALRHPSFAPALERALATSSPAARRAAAWALGELPGPRAASAALTAAARDDVDPLVRRLAAAALDKLEAPAIGAAGTRHLPSTR